MPTLAVATREFRRLSATESVIILGPADALDTLRLLRRARVHAACVMLDPPYGVASDGVGERWNGYVLRLLRAAPHVADHVFLWNFPHRLAWFVERIPTALRLVSWLTWTYKNAPFRAHGWRPSQQACLHLVRPGAKLHPENFYAEEHEARRRAGTLKFRPAPTSAFDHRLIVGQAGRAEAVGHPQQKPIEVFRRLLLMATRPGELVVDVMAGSGTTGAAAMSLERRAILCDRNDKYVHMAAERLGVRRVLNVNLSPPSKKRRLTAPEKLEERRRRAVDEVEKGRSQAEVARQLKVSRAAVSKWVAAHRSRKGDGLALRPRQGRSPKLSSRQLASLRKVVAGRATAAGFTDDRWTGPRLASLIWARFKIPFHPDYARRLLTELMK